MAILDTGNLLMPHLLGAAVLQNAIPESGYAMSKSKLSQFTAIYQIMQIEKIPLGIETQNSTTNNICCSKTSVEKLRAIFPPTTQAKGQLRTRQQNSPQTSELSSLNGLDISIDLTNGT